MILNLPAATGARARRPSSKVYHAKDEGRDVDRECPLLAEQLGRREENASHAALF